tara:strand:+ start:485 stop:772 length:288 start_codon:yes stop_codon:yes gene_type:complete
MNAIDSGVSVGLENTHLFTKISKMPKLFFSPTLNFSVLILAVILSKPCNVTKFPSNHLERDGFENKIKNTNKIIIFLIINIIFDYSRKSFFPTNL